MTHYKLNEEVVSAKEIRTMAEEYLGSVAYHLPISGVVVVLKDVGFNFKEEK